MFSTQLVWETDNQRRLKKDSKNRGGIWRCDRLKINERACFKSNRVSTVETIGCPTPGVA
jgi:hypothetical protein